MLPRQECPTMSKTAKMLVFMLADGVDQVRASNTNLNKSIRLTYLCVVRGLPLSTYALRGRGGVGPNADVVLRLSKRGCVNLRTRGGRGVKKAEKSAYVLNGCSLMRQMAGRPCFPVAAAARPLPSSLSFLPGSGMVRVSTIQFPSIYRRYQVARGPPHRMENAFPCWQGRLGGHSHIKAAQRGGRVSQMQIHITDPLRVTVSSVPPNILVCPGWSA